ncbi:MAG: aquaporin [Phycisphaerales bacterium]|nr:aquaporin [Phycisphaerales bacterium]MDP6987439.1 aquaporin [Phycisphaerales bacterium]
MNRSLYAEVIGTFALTFVGGGAIIVTEGSDLLVIALAHGLILFTMVAALLHISGAQFNPAVSVAIAAIGKQPWSRAITFMAAQLVGAVGAALLLKATFSFGWSFANEHIGETLGRYSGADGPEFISAWRVLVLEAVAAFFLMFVIMGVAVDSKNARHAGIAGLAIGLVVAADILCFGPATGASMNPARSFGPALVLGRWTLHWAYWVGPIAGAAFAAWTYHRVIGTSES